MHSLKRFWAHQTCYTLRVKTLVLRLRRSNSQRQTDIKTQFRVDTGGLTFPKLVANFYCIFIITRSASPVPRVLSSVLPLNCLRPIYCGSFLVPSQIYAKVHGNVQGAFLFSSFSLSHSSKQRGL